MKVPVLRSPKQRTLASAIGATAKHEDPLAKQAIERVKSGDLAKSDFHKLYKGNVRAGVIAGTNKHSAKYGFSKWKNTEQYMNTLPE